MQTPPEDEMRIKMLVSALPDTVQLSNKSCRRFHSTIWTATSSGGCQCPSGRCWYMEQTHRRADGMPAIDSEHWLEHGTADLLDAQIERLREAVRTAVVETKRIAWQEYNAVRERIWIDHVDTEAIVDRILAALDADSGGEGSTPLAWSNQRQAWVKPTDTDSGGE